MTTPAKRIATWLKVVSIAGAAAAIIVAFFVFGSPGGDGGTIVPAPDAEMTGATVEQLANASAAQGVCYGWQLLSGRTVVSRGSNLGAGTAVDSDPARCPKWVEVRSSVTWTSASSEAPDSAWVTVTATGVSAPAESGLARFGLDDKAFIDEPEWAICQAALALPLLTAETGAVPPAPTPSGAAAPPATLPAAGNDFWRDRWPYVVGGALLFVFAALAVAVGWFERKHARTVAKNRRRKAAAKPPTKPPAKPPNEAASPA